MLEKAAPEMSTLVVSSTPCALRNTLRSITLSESNLPLDTLSVSRPDDSVRDERVLYGRRRNLDSIERKIKRRDYYPKGHLINSAEEIDVSYAALERFKAERRYCQRVDLNDESRGSYGSGGFVLSEEDAIFFLLDSNQQWIIFTYHAL
jgi:hypothetical protein